jgi:ribose-phosphate pyrophosphokinase
MSTIKLFSGTAHPKLSQEVAEKLGVPLSKAEVIRFDDSECRVTIQEDVKDQTCVIIQPTCNPTDENIMELILFCDALKRSEAKKVIGVLPMYGYARQNAQHRSGECVSMNIVTKLLETVGLDEIYTFDLHEVASSGIFSVPFENMFAFSAMVSEVKEYLGSTSLDDVVIVAPDEGIERPRLFGKELFGNDDFLSAVVDKKRDLNNKHISEAKDIYGDIQGKVAIIVDDVVTSGGTLINAAELCKTRGATKVIGVFTHHDFSEGTAQKLQDSAFEILFTVNTLPLRKTDLFNKLHEVSIASLIADKIQKL